MSWDMEPWEPVQLDTVDGEPDVIDAYWQPVDDAPVMFADDEPVDAHVEWLEADADEHPVPRESTEIEHYEPTQEDMDTANEWLARVETMTQPQSQLATHINTRPQTLTALWRRVTNPLQTNTSRESYSSHKSDYRASAGNTSKQPGWYFIAERDESEPESLQHLRYWYMQSEFCDGITEWDEKAFLVWVDSLSDDELATFANAGEQIALGNWQNHVSEPVSDVIDATRESKERDATDHVGYFFDSLRRVF
ncbi:MAG: hypothetical protein AAF267_22115 [Deinococcota bacterium]